MTMILPKIEKKKPAGKSGLSVFFRRRPVLIAACLILIVVLWNILHLAKKKSAQPQGLPVIAAKATKAAGKTRGYRSKQQVWGGACTTGAFTQPCAAAMRPPKM